MKILEICMSKGFGGLELYVLKIAEYLDGNGHNYKVFTKKNSFLNKKLSSINVFGGSLSSVFHMFPLFSSIYLARYINANKIDVLHVHWGKDLLFVVLAKLFCRRKIKLIYTRHMALTRNKDDFYHRFIYRNVDGYLTVTQELKNIAGKYLPIDKDKIHLIYLGVPALEEGKVDCQIFNKEYGLSREAFRIVIFGRIEKGKGQHLVIEAVKLLREHGHNIQLALIGHIMDDKYHSSLIGTINKNNLNDSVFYLGFHNDPTSIMPCFDAVVLATKCETFGLVLPEAMRAGVAVIGSNCGGVPEIITHEKTGLLFETENINDLVLQLSKIINNKELCKNLAREGKVEADERFSEEKHFEKLISYLKSA